MLLYMFCTAESMSLSSWQSWLIYVQNATIGSEEKGISSLQQPEGPCQHRSNQAAVQEAT